MSQENSEIVRRYFEVLDRTLAAYRAHPGPVSETPFIDELFACLDPDTEWKWPLNSQGFRGREALLRGATDFLETVDDWRIEPEEIVDAGDGQVFAVQRVSARGKGSGVPFEQLIFTALTLRDGKITHIHDYTERAEALEAAGLSE